MVEARCRVGTGLKAALKPGSGDRLWVRTGARGHRQAKSGSESESGCRLKVRPGLESVQGCGGQEQSGSEARIGYGQS